MGLSKQCQAEWALDRVRAFLDAVPGESGLSAADVDRLCGIAHGRGDLPLTPMDVVTIKSE